MKIIHRILIFMILIIPCVSLGEEIIYSCSSVVDSALSLEDYPLFREHGQLSVQIPGLAEGFIPQGITWLPEEDALLFSGYSGRGDHSVLLEVSLETGELIRQVRLINADGSMYTGHAGGCCATDSDIYISDGAMLNRISKETFYNFPTVSVYCFEEIIPVPVSAAFCNYSEGILWVGEFEHIKETDVSHGVMSADGYQQAWICGYHISDKQDFTVPDYVLSVPDRIQGMTTLNGKIYLSQSYHRRNDSMLLRYSDILSSDPDKMINVNGQDVPLWILDRTKKEGDLVCPTMLEGLYTVGEKIYMVFESAAEKYMDPSWPSRNPIDRVFCLSF